MFPSRLVNSWRNAAEAVRELQVRAEAAESIVPVGTVVLSLLDPGKHGAPSGWLFCDGATHSSAQYPALARLLGSRYGGDGVTTFAVPDLHGASGSILTYLGAYVKPEYVNAGGTDVATYGVGNKLSRAYTVDEGTSYNVFMGSCLVRAR